MNTDLDVKIKKLKLRIVKLNKARHTQRELQGNSSHSPKQYSLHEWNIICLDYAILNHTNELHLLVATQLIGDEDE